VVHEDLMRPREAGAKVHCENDSIVGVRVGFQGWRGAAWRLAFQARAMTAWLLLPALLALVAYALAALPLAATEGFAGKALVVGWVAHGAAIAIDVGGVGRALSGARFGFAPALSATMWLVLAVYGIESRLMPIKRVRRSLAVLAAIVVAVAAYFPGEMVEPHASWAPVHWLLGIASYGLFGAAVLHAGMLSAADRQMRQRSLTADRGPAGVPLLRLERLTFQFVTAGFIALTATLVLGWWFTSVWKWEHKIVFSVLAWLVFAGLLAGRAAFGWRGRRATGWVYAGAALLLLAYVGSRFVFEVLLHRPFE
jgi:ABC-type uncharacterized transport system permease subunit